MEPTEWFGLLLIVIGSIWGMNSIPAQGSTSNCGQVYYR